MCCCSSGICWSSFPFHTCLNCRLGCFSLKCVPSGKGSQQLSLLPGVQYTGLILGQGATCCLVFEAPSGFEDKSRSSSCPSCSHLRVQNNSDEEFGSLSLSLPSLLLKVMVLFVLEVDSAGFLVQRGAQQTGQVCLDLAPALVFPAV